MFASAKLYQSRNVVRFALIAVSGIWLTGCSSDATRLTEAMNTPFANPFASSPSTAQGDAAPTPAVSSQPLASSGSAGGNVAYQAPAHASPVASAPIAEPAPAATGSIRAPSQTTVAGGPGGWTAVGGSPVLVIEGDTADSLARRYGVPTQALLGANGLKSASQVHPGMHVIVPVYNAHGVASNVPAPIPAATELPHKATSTAEANAKKARTKTDVAESDDTDKKSTKAKDRKSKTAASEDDKSSKTRDKKAKAETSDATGTKDTKARDKKAKGESADAADPKAKDKKAKTETADASQQPKAKAADPAQAKGKTAEAKSTPSETTKVPASKPDARTANVDNMPTARTAPQASADPKTSAEADADGANPEFRWPARGRIIQAFKSGGNDGINISVPEGTSVRAAESGVVAYAGSELKGYGNLILIRHPNGFVTAYANNGEIDVKKGDQVKRGQVIAKSGESGNVSTPQLHFELRDKAGQPVDPTNYLAGI